ILLAYSGEVKRLGLSLNGETGADGYIRQLIETILIGETRGELPAKRPVENLNAGIRNRGLAVSREDCALNGASNGSRNGDTDNLSVIAGVDGSLRGTSKTERIKVEGFNQERSLADVGNRDLAVCVGATSAIQEMEVAGAVVNEGIRKRS